MESSAGCVFVDRGREKKNSQQIVQNAWLFIVVALKPRLTTFFLVFLFFYFYTHVQRTMKKKFSNC